MPIEKLKDLVLSELFFSIGIAYEKDIGPIAVIKSNEVPIEVLNINIRGIRGIITIPYRTGSYKKFNINIIFIIKNKRTTISNSRCKKFISS